MKGFGYGIAAGVMATFAGLTSVFVGLALFVPERLPAPALSRIVNIDEKLRFLRENRHFDPHILAVGSSITWRQLAGAAFDPERSGRFLNGGLVHVKIHQTREVADFYLAHYRNIRDLLMLVSLPDFEDCTGDSPEMFDPEDAARYVFEGWPAAYFYARYFAPQRYARTALTLPSQRVPLRGDLYFDAYGSGPVQEPSDVDLGLRYKAIDTDPACTKDLIDLSREVSAQGIRLTIVFAPIHPDYHKQYPAASAAIAQVAEDVRRATEGDNTGVMVMHDDKRFGRRDFWDAFHMQWTSAQTLSEIIVRGMQAAKVASSTGAAPHESRAPKGHVASATAPAAVGRFESIRPTPQMTTNRDDPL